MIVLVSDEYISHAMFELTHSTISCIVHCQQMAVSEAK